MTLSEALNPKIINALKAKVRKGDFPGLSFEMAMQFALSDGILPKSNLDLNSFYQLEDWLRAQGTRVVSFSATALKNNTGEVLEKAIQGYTVQILKHGRPIVEITGMPTGSK